MKIGKFNKKNVKIFSKYFLQRISFFFLLIILVTFLLAINSITSRISLKAGEVAPRDITSTETVEFVNKAATEKLKEEAIKSTPEVYNLNLVSIESVDEELYGFFREIKELRNEYNLLIEQQLNDNNESETAITEEFINYKSRLLTDRYSFNSESTIANLLKLDEISLEEVEHNVNHSINKVMQQGIKENDLEEAKKQIIREISGLSTSPYTAILSGEIGEIFLKPSLFLDKEATQFKKDAAAAAVSEVKDVIRKDQIIIRKGEVVTNNHIDRLEALGLQNASISFKNIFGLLLNNTVLILLLNQYLYTYHRATYDDIQKLILLGVIYMVAIFIAKIASGISGYLIPTAFASMLIAITLDPRLALWMTFLITFNIGFILSGEMNYLVTSLAGGLVSVFCIRKATQRSSLTRAGLFIAGINIFSITALGFVYRNSIDFILKNATWGVLNGFASVILTIGILPFLESFFDITSSFKLMELSNPNQPLLKQLLVEAPGTYHHSVVVGNLAEAAADEIEANSLLARVGAYYHDVGKLKRPYFFSENQEAYKNIHDEMEPSLSALVIASHVKDGVDTARKYKLPKKIVDIINQHHGTGLISYFYHRALQTTEEKTGEVNEGIYRYSGPKPQSKEAGIILLADMLEAEARTLTNPTASRIKSLAQNVINRNVVNGQLDDCNLTLRELSRINDVFSRILTGMFHNRVEYPDEELIEKLKKERSQSESNNKKSTEPKSKYSEIEKPITESNGNNQSKKNK
ncbi:MAG: HDIG domain-containing protein [Candidatus Atribacteria bacterium]|jgi:putative nucleotidyltransferase with HDIG domain|nr:HDIG domain-containing protein [Candidatus Atribacteria bacterium]